MTAGQRHERDLGAILEDLYLGPTPDYEHQAIATATRRRQRPAWSFPGRWLPVVDFAPARPLVVRGSWRTIGVVVVILALLIAAAVLVVGSRETRLPPPFGVAGNGLLVSSLDGDIVIIDPLTGARSVIVGDPEPDLRPVFARDGTRLLFLRTTAPTVHILMVADATGAHVRAVPGVPPIDLEDTVEFAPDGRTVVVGALDGSIRRYAIDGSRPPQTLGQGRLVGGEARPPDGAQLLFENDATDEIDLWIMDADGSNAHVVIASDRLAGAAADLREVEWSPTGTEFAFGCTSADEPDGSHICVANADGTNLHRVGDVDPGWYDTEFAWSPKGDQIAFDTWDCRVPGRCDIQPIGITSPAGGPVRRVGIAPAPEGAMFDYSPDGTSLLTLPGRFQGAGIGDPEAPVLIDVASGTSRPVPWTVASNVSWQRLAP